MKITPNNITAWMASTGFIFPRTTSELRRFEKLYADIVIPESELLDPEVILGIKTGKVISLDKPVQKPAATAPLKMAARKGERDIPQNILDKIKKNQQQTKGDDNGSQKE
jgi:hypothetical protein